MPPIVALLLCWVFIFYVIKTDAKGEGAVSAALWIPLAWFLLTASRPIELWFSQEVLVLTEASYEEGSAWNRIIYPGLTLLGLIVLLKRRVNWSAFMRGNIWLLVWFGYCGLSILWSDFPFISFKRWVKVLCVVIMVLVVLSEDDPVEAIKQVIRRCAYILVPLSIVLIKYYPALGTSWSPWGDGPYILGVTDNKNGLGRLCMIFGFYVFYELAESFARKKNSRAYKRFFIHLLYGTMIIYLLMKANCATGVACLAAGITTFAALQLSFIRRTIGKAVVVVPFLLLLLLMVVLFTDIVALLLQLLGRDSTLTTRTVLWKDLIGMHTPLLTGVGYDSFWLGPRLTVLWDKWWWQPNEAHNGYLEIYLELGIAGVCLFSAFFLSAFAKTRKYYAGRYGFFSYQVAWLIIFLLYNITEVAIKGLNSAFFMFLLLAIDYQRKVGQCPKNADG